MQEAFKLCSHVSHASSLLLADRSSSPNSQRSRKRASSTLQPCTYCESPSKAQFCSRFVFIACCQSPVSSHLSFLDRKRVKDWVDEWKCLFVYAHNSCVFYEHIPCITHLAMGESPWTPVVLGAVIRGPQNKPAAWQESL